MKYLIILFPLIGFILGFIFGYIALSSYERNKSDFLVFPLYIGFCLAFEKRNINKNNLLLILII